jgi:hypothetical protein
MSTAPPSFSSALGTAIDGSEVLSPGKGKVRRVVAVPEKDGTEGVVRPLTIYRQSKTHHGRTMLMLGHAAEYLVGNQGLFAAGAESKADAEAVHILMRLSREVFDDYAKSVAVNRPVSYFVMDCLSRLLQ